MTIRKHIKFIQEGQYAAKVAVDLIESQDGWGPYLSVEDVRKLDEVRQALRDGDLATAMKHGTVYRLTPVTAA